MSEPVVVAFPTIMSGLVVRWYVNEAAHDRGLELASASRERALTYFEGDAELTARVEEVHQRIAKAGHDADLSDVLTHKRHGLFGPLVALSAGGDTP